MRVNALSLLCACIEDYMATMKRACFFVAVLLAGFVAEVEGADARIIKTLPHFLDAKGRHSLHPSLFERDAYQLELKSDPEKRSGMRFDVQWKARALKEGGKLKLELRGSKTAPRAVEVFEVETPRGGLFSRWTGISVSGPEFEKVGSVIAWRVSLWEGGTLLAEQKSFLW